MMVPLSAVVGGIFFIVVLLFLVFFVTKLALQVVRQLRFVESLIFDTLEDLQESASAFDTLVHRRSFLSDDPDIQQIRRVFAVTLDILGEYIKNVREITKDFQKEETETTEEG